VSSSAYLLDTNALSDAIRWPRGPIAIRMREIGSKQIATSPIVACELRYGAALKGNAGLSQRVDQLLNHLDVLPFQGSVDRVYAAIRSHLERIGKAIGANDLLIAAHAIATERVLVTNNVREFGRVPGLRVEDWRPTPAAEKS
jgi:tRNA(fMet)-specific endonuclease VapC